MEQPTNSYWENRALIRMTSYQRNAGKTINTITAAYDKAIEDINAEINKIFNKYAEDGMLSVDAAMELLNQPADKKVLDDLRSQLHDIKDERIKRQLLNRLNAPAYKARITRLQALKEQVYIESKKIADSEIQASTIGYIDTINDAYYKNLFDIQKGLSVGFDVAAMPSKTIEAILKNPWSGEHFSSRVWDNTDVLAGKLNEIITAGFQSGASIRKMTKEIEDMSAIGKHAAARLIRTETTYMANAAEMESYTEAEIDQYMFMATLDNRTSEICQEHDGKVYKVKDAVPGENMPPLHPYCRSTTRAWFGDDTLNSIQRRARDPATGKTYLVPANMTYKQWYKDHVVDKYGQDQADVMKKKVLNESSDRKQHERYKVVLGDDLPKSFASFQELKYNNLEDYKLIRLDYSRRTKLANNPSLKLPNAEKATIAEDKFTKYLFNGNNPKGLLKGELITKKLGYNINNYQEFKDDILTRAQANPATHKGYNKYGGIYEQRIIFYSEENKPVNLEIGWLNDADSTHMTSIYVNEVKDDEN